MLIIVGFIIFIIAFLLRSQYERKTLSTDFITICTPKIKQAKTFVFISDLHNWNPGDQNKAMIRIIDEIHPDFILVGGDCIISWADGKVEKENALHLMKQLSLRYPVYCGNGNHENRLIWKNRLYGDEYQQLVEQLKSMGVTYLAGESVMIDETIRVTGIDLPHIAYEKMLMNKKPDLSARELFHGIEKPAAKRFEILLAHTPLYFDQYREWGADLTLSGHYHGGTIRLPIAGGIGVMTPQFEFFSPYSGGMVEKDGQKIIVSRGIGTHSINIRINNKPQLVVVRLVK